MKESFVVNAETRGEQGKGASRRLRRTGKVPAILYGGKQEPKPLSLNHHELAKQLELEAFYSHILDIKVDGATEQAVLKDVQRHPARPVILHVDLQRVLADQAIRMHVPLHFAGGESCPGVKEAGGIVEHHLNQVEVECLPKDLPEYLEVDLSGLGLNDSVHLSKIKLPAGVRLVELVHGNDQTVAAVHMPRAVIEIEAEEAAAAAAAAAAEGVAPEGEAAVAAPPAEAKPEAAEAKPKPEEKKK